MRSNVTAKNVALNRVRQLTDLNSRKCRAKKEILGHIFDMCLYTKNKVSAGMMKSKISYYT